MKNQEVVLGGGCFWCLEPIFSRIEGVKEVLPGYAGGTTKNPTYEEVCTTDTGHVEVIKIVFNPEKVTFKKLLEVFWFSHDPTTLNRQGNDIGEQYRSIILFQNKEQQELAENYKNRLEEMNVFDHPVVTEIKALETFYPAEISHKEYYERNPGVPYCSMVIHPKVERFKAAFGEILK